MSTAATTPNKFYSFLEGIGHAFVKVFKKVDQGITAVEKIEPALQILVSSINPAIGGALATVNALIVGAQQRFQAIGASADNGPQKLQDVTNAIFPTLQGIFAQYGVKVDLSHAQGFAQGVVDALKALPDISGVTPPASAITAAAPSALKTSSLGGVASASAGAAINGGS